MDKIHTENRILDIVCYMLAKYLAISIGYMLSCDLRKQQAERKSVDAFFVRESYHSRPIEAPGTAFNFKIHYDSQGGWKFFDQPFC